MTAAKRIVSELLGDPPGAESPKQMFQRLPRWQRYRFSIGNDKHPVTFCFSIISQSPAGAVALANIFLNDLATDNVGLSVEVQGRLGCKHDSVFHINDGYVLSENDISDVEDLSAKEMQRWNDVSGGD